jgi:hypothetical protein
LETDTITGLPGNTSKLVRFGADGLAFRTSNNQVVIAHSGIAAPTILGDDRGREQCGFASAVESTQR